MSPNRLYKSSTVRGLFRPIPAATAQVFKRQKASFEGFKGGIDHWAKAYGLRQTRRRDLRKVQLARTSSNRRASERHHRFDEEVSCRGKLKIAQVIQEELRGEESCIRTCRLMEAATCKQEEPHSRNFV